MISGKTQLRTNLKQARLVMDEGVHRLASQAIVERLKQLTDWSEVKSLHYFEPLRQLREPDLNEFIIYLEDNYSTLHLCTSRRIEDQWEVVGVHGGQPPDKFDVIIVPMLGFDPKTLHRLGYGGGYYDKFLATQPQTQKIGVCFDQGKTDNLPGDPHDIALDIIITDTSIYKARMK